MEIIIMKINDLKNIFMEKFENPSDNEVYDSHEGGFSTNNMIDTEDAVNEVFRSLSDEEKKSLIEELNKEAFKWVKK